MIVGITRDLLNGLQALHEEVICQNDVNDENVMIYDDDDSAVLIDFNKSVLVDDSDDTFLSFGDTEGYVHPAVNTSVWVTKQQVDYHAFGMLTYQICCNTLPCHEIDDLDLTSPYNNGRICDEIQDFFIRE